MLSPNKLQEVQREYAEAQILSAQPVVIIQMLYEVAIRALDAARLHLRNKEHMARAKEVSRAQEAVNELILALDGSVSSTLAPGLASLYTYVQEQILLGHVRQSDSHFREAVSILKVLLEGWTGVRKQQALGTSVTEEILLAPAQDAPDPVLTGRASAYQEEPESPSRDWNC